MKKRIMLILTLTVSLFIYSNRVNAGVPMWMYCGTMDFESACNASTDSDAKYYYMYNTIVTINGYQMKNTYFHKHVFYNKDDFWAVYGPTFMMNGPDGLYRDSPNDDHVCWYNDQALTGYGQYCEDDNGHLSDCDVENGNYIIGSERFYDVVCPKAVYQTSSYATSGGTKGNFVVAIGEKNPVEVEILDGYKIALYRFYNHGKDARRWVMEVYDDGGYYAFLYFKKVSDICGIITNSLAKTICENSLTRGRGNAFRDLLKNAFSISLEDIAYPLYEKQGDQITFGFDDDFMDDVQAIQLYKVWRNGQKFYDITSDDPDVHSLLANVAVIAPQIDIEEKYVYDSGQNSVWNITNEWYGVAESSLSSQYELLTEFSENGKYYDLISEAQKAAEAISVGKKYNLPDDTDLGKVIEDANNALESLKNINDDPPSFPSFSNSPLGGTKVEGTSCYAHPKEYSDAKSSLGDYIFCNTIGDSVRAILFDYSYNTFKRDVADGEFVSTNPTMILEVFERTLSDQINVLKGGKVDLVNYEKNIKEYVTNIAKFLAYIKKNYKDELTEKQLNDLSSCVDDYLNFARTSFEIEIIIDCDTLLGEDFIERISKYVNIVRIAVPILLIGFGIFDFVSAIFANDDSKMKKAQQKFLMRVGIAVLFFLLPIVIKLILTIANKAWSFISPDTCNL